MSSFVEPGVHVNGENHVVRPSGSRNPRPMRREFQIRFTAILLALLTVAAVIFAWINFQKEREYAAPYDGVWWVESSGWLQAERVDKDGPGDKAGIREGDILTAINGRTVNRAATLQQQMARNGIYVQATYSVLRGDIPLDVNVILVPADKTINFGLRLIALIYLGIGLYVLFRRFTAPKSTHFYLFCLVSFIIYAFKYTGKLNTFDEMVYWSNVVAWLLQPALFLHFSLTFPEKKESVRRHGWIVPLVYLPALALLPLHVFAVRALTPSELLRWDVDRIEMFYLAAFFFA